MINYTEHNKLAMPDLNSPADIRVISEVINNIDDGLSKFYVATSNTKNLYNITTGINKTELKNGYSIKIGIPSDSDNNVTVSVDNIVIPVKKPNGNPVKNFKANGVYSLTYYNGSFILVSGADESDTTNVGIDGSKVLTGTTFVGSDGEVHNGTMPNNGTLETTLTTHGATYNIPSGYTSGGLVKTNITNCTAENIKYNVSVGGVTGSFTGDGTIDASKVIKDYIGYSKGSRIVGAATLETLEAYKVIKGTYPDNLVLDSQQKDWTIPNSNKIYLFLHYDKGIGKFWAIGQFSGYGNHMDLSQIGHNEDIKYRDHRVIEFINDNTLRFYTPGKWTLNSEGNYYICVYR